MGRHDPNALTSREREVLDLVRRGLTNEEIARRLGISLDGAKYHVSQILSKLGVASREEAVVVASGDRRRWWAAWPLWARIAGAATAAIAVVAGLASLVYDRISGTGEEDLPAQSEVLTVEEAYARIRDGITRPGFVLHTTTVPQSTTEDGREASKLNPFDTREFWIDGTRNRFRAHEAFRGPFIVVGDSIDAPGRSRENRAATSQVSGADLRDCPGATDHTLAYLICGELSFAEPPSIGFTVRLDAEEEYAGRPAVVLVFEQSQPLQIPLAGPCELALPPLTPAPLPSDLGLRSIVRVYVDGREFLPVARVNEYFIGSELCPGKAFEYHHEFLDAGDLPEDWFDPRSVDHIGPQSTR